MRDTGIEPVTSSVSGKRATAAPIAPKWAVQLFSFSFLKWRWRRDSNPCKRLCRPVPSRSATPPLWNEPRDELHKVAHTERMTRFELATLTLARLCATTALHPRCHLNFRPDDSLNTTRRFGSRKTTTGSRVSPTVVQMGSFHRVVSVRTQQVLRAIGAVGSALPSHGRGHRFESGIAHQTNAPSGWKSWRGFWFPTSRWWQFGGQNGARGVTFITSLSLTATPGPARCAGAAGSSSR